MYAPASGNAASRYGLPNETIATRGPPIPCTLSTKARNAAGTPTDPTPERGGTYAPTTTASTVRAAARSESYTAQGVSGPTRAAENRPAEGRRVASKVRPASSAPGRAYVTLRTFDPGASGSTPSWSRTRVSDAVAARSATARCAAVPTRVATASGSTRAPWCSPSRAFASSSRLTERSIRSRVTRPDSTAAATASMVAPIPSGASSTSDPASSASTAASPTP